MKAVVFHGIGDTRRDNFKEPCTKHDFDTIVCLTASTICGRALHFVRGTAPRMHEGTILGHEISTPVQGRSFIPNAAERTPHPRLTRHKI